MTLGDMGTLLAPILAGVSALSWQLANAQARSNAMMERLLARQESLEQRLDHLSATVQFHISEDERESYLAAQFSPRERGNEKEDSR